VGTLAAVSRRVLGMLLVLAVVAGCGGGTVSAKPSKSAAHVTTAPSESVTERARVAAESVNAIQPLQAAVSTCTEAIKASFKDQAIGASLKTLLGPEAKDVVDVSQRANDTIEIQYELSNGQIDNATFDAGRIVFAILGYIPEFKLFGIIGDPAIYCTEAAFWYTGNLGGQIGQLLRSKLRPSATAASIEGNWTLYRRSTSCTSNLSQGCAVTPMLLRITCADRNCTAMRTNNTPGVLGAWTDPLPLVLSNGTWQARGPEADASSCHDKPAPGTAVALKLRVTSTAVINGVLRATQLQGTYVVYGAPTTCTNGKPSLGSFTVSSSNSH